MQDLSVIEVYNFFPCPILQRDHVWICMKMEHERMIVMMLLTRMAYLFQCFAILNQRLTQYGRWSHHFRWQIKALICHHFIKMCKEWKTSQTGWITGISPIFS